MTELISTHPGLAALSVEWMPYQEAMRRIMEMIWKTNGTLQCTEREFSDFTTLTAEEVRDEILACHRFMQGRLREGDINFFDCILFAQELNIVAVLLILAQCGMTHDSVPMSNFMLSCIEEEINGSRIAGYVDPTQPGIADVKWHLFNLVVRHNLLTTDSAALISSTMTMELLPA